MPAGHLRLSRLGAAALLGLLMAGSAGAADAPRGQATVDTSHLRVCADPAALPLSDEQGQGFENELARLMAAHLGRPLSYTWHPQSMGFVRNTLGARLCDLVIGVVAADELVQNTNPYYRSTYVLLHRAGEGDRFGDLASPMARIARIGVVAGTPPADLLARLGLFANVEAYHLVVDTRAEQPVREMIQALADGRLDMALAWGPIAGWWARRSPVPMELVPLQSDPRQGLRFDFLISMGVRQGEPDWKDQINDALRGLKPEIDRILDAYAVPRLDGRGRLIGVWAEAAAEPAGEVVPEPAGYRMDRYRAPTPATLQGATVLDTAALRRLIAEDDPLLVDVLPRPRKPAGRPEGQLWIEPRREDIPGSVWLPNTGYGELPPETARWFAAELRRLTGGDRARPLVFYCDRHCWMSWNAARRAVTELGYTAVHWYPDGVQGWQEAGQRVAEAVPGLPPGEGPPATP
jgi:quinoprotein dehydrogenase-associated probable ABC transporter substrate-binding protein/PQQ-dependent catabolism-associated CXXCW motif protein